MTIIEKLTKVFIPDTDILLIAYLLPIGLALFSIVCLWLFFISLNQFVKKKAEQWKDEKLQTNFTRRLIVSQKTLIRQSLSSFRQVTTICIFLLLVSHLLKLFSSDLKESISKINSRTFGFWNSVAHYSLSASSFLSKIATILFNIFLTILIAVWCLKVIQKTLNVIINAQQKHPHKLENSRLVAKKNTLNYVTNNILKIVVIILASFTILDSIGINIAAILATAGVASVAIGFGAQNLVKDFIAGFFIIFEDQMTTGDTVDLSSATGSFSGTVEKITLRMIRIRSNEGSLLTIPNGDIRSVKNYSTDWSRIDFKYNLELKANIEQASAIFREEIALLCSEYAKEVVGSADIRPLEKIVDFENRSVAVTFRFFLKTINIQSKMKIESEFNKRIISRFKDENIYLSQSNR